MLVIDLQIVKRKFFGRIFDSFFMTPIPSFAFEIFTLI